MPSQSTRPRRSTQLQEWPEEEEETRPRKRSARAADAASGQTQEVTQEDDDDIVRMTQFYATQNQGTQSSKLSTEESNALVRAVMRHMLFKQFEKPDVPVSRAELTSMVQANYKDHAGKRNIAGGIIQKAQALFPKIFGMELKEIVRRARSKGTLQGGEGNKEYILRSLLPTDLHSRFVRRPEEDASKGLLVIILALIKLNGEKISEDELHRMLEELGISPEQPHPTFGKIEDQLEHFAKKRYLVKSQCASADGMTTHVYECGEHAEHEVPPAVVDEFIHKELGNAD